MLGRNSGAAFTHFLLSWLNRFSSVSFPQTFVRFLGLFSLSLRAALQTVSPNPIADRLLGRRECADGSLCPSRAATSMTHFQRNSIHLFDPLGQIFCKFCQCFPNTIFLRNLFYSIRNRKTQEIVLHYPKSFILCKLFYVVQKM